MRIRVSAREGGQITTDNAGQTKDKPEITTFFSTQKGRAPSAPLHHHDVTSRPKILVLSQSKSTRKRVRGDTCLTTYTERQSRKPVDPASLSSRLSPTWTCERASPPPRSG